MNLGNVTKIVALCLSVSLVAGIVACDNKTDDESKFQRAEGASSQTGQLLSKNDWCDSAKKAQDGKIAVVRYTFDKSGLLTIEPSEFDSSLAKLKATSQIQQTWGLLGDQLIFTQNGKSTPYTLSPTPTPEPALDKVQCLNMADLATGTTDTICPCND